MSAYFHENLKAARKKAGLTQLELAKKIGTTKSTISLYESGKREPDILRLKAIADALDVTCDFLLGIESIPRMHAEFQELQRRYGSERLKAYIDALYNIEDRCTQKPHS